MINKAESEESVIHMYLPRAEIYPREVAGRYTTLRWLCVFLTQLVFYGLPWMQWNGRQAVLFDLVARKFYIFGIVLWPQDFIYLAALLIIAAYSLFLFTAIAGRVWCGFACPQTVYTEIFMWIERKIEGPRSARMRLARQPWNAEKITRKSTKHALWALLALWTGLTFVSYFTPAHTLMREVGQFSLGPWEWFWILFYSFATYGNAGWMREQVCKYMCPYARFQSAMFDRDTLIISYDSERGEPRGSRSRKADPKTRGLGSCIDCGLCVQVCPTGIDIRQGLQYECIGCAACIDVCDGVMDKMAYPRGLIRYDTQNGLARHLSRRQRWARIFRPRVLVYGAILGLVVLGLAISLVLRHPFKVDVVRDRGALARQIDEGQIENVYRLQIMNTTEQAQHLQVAVQGLAGISLSAVPELRLGPAEARWVTLAVRIPAETALAKGAGAHPIHFEIGLLNTDAAGKISRGASLSEKSSFIVPR